MYNFKLWQFFVKHAAGLKAYKILPCYRLNYVVII